MDLNEHDLNTMATGSVVKNRDNDKWTKAADGTWGVSGGGSSYQGWSSSRLLASEGPIIDPSKPSVVTSDVLTPAFEQPAKDVVRLETLEAQTAWLDQGYDDDLFMQGLTNGWFTEKFFKDLAEGDAF